MMAGNTTRWAGGDVRVMDAGGDWGPAPFQVLTILANINSINRATNYSPAIGCDIFCPAR